jgi:hypothetical protein
MKNAVIKTAPDKTMESSICAKFIPYLSGNETLRSITLQDLLSAADFQATALMKC